MAIFGSLDRIDRKLLAELDRNSRRPLAEVSRKLKLGSDIVAYRVERLLRDGVVNRFSAYFDMFLLGKSCFKTYLKLDAQRGRTAELVNFLNDNKQTFWLAEWYGHWDLLFSYWVVDAREFQEACDVVFSRFGDIIVDIAITANVEVELYSRTFGVRDDFLIYGYGKNRDRVTLDEIEKEMLPLLSVNARIGIKEMAEQLGCTPTMIKYRLQNLERKGVIFAYQLQLNYSMSDLLFFKLLVSLSNYKIEDQNKIREFCREHPNVVVFIKQIGSWSIEIEIEVSSYNEFHKIVDELKEQLSSSIKSIDTLLLRQDHYHRVANVEGQNTS